MFDIKFVEWLGAATVYGIVGFILILLVVLVCSEEDD